MRNAKRTQTQTREETEMRNGDLTDSYDYCPVHGTDLLREVDFVVSDATVCAYDGCKCATVWTEASWMDGGEYYTTRQGAVARAKMLVRVGSIPLSASGRR